MPANAVGEVAVRPRQQLYDGAAGADDDVGEVAVRVDQREHPGGLAVRDHQRADGQPGPAGGVTRGDQRDGAGHPAAEPTYRVRLGVQERVVGVDRQDASLDSSASGPDSDSFFLDSSLARVAYMSTYSWPESRMISYMISSVIERRM